MAAALDDEIERAVDLRPHVATFDRQLGQRGGDVEDRKRAGGVLDGRGCRRHGSGELVEAFELDPERAVRGAGDLGFELAQFGGGEADLAGEGLAMDERGVERRRHQLVAVLGCHLDKIAEHVVVPNFQRPHRGRVGIAAL